jgi:hypothetical protein
LFFINAVFIREFVAKKNSQQLLGVFVENTGIEPVTFPIVIGTL